MGQTADLEELTAHLTEAGYVRCEQVEGPGQFALRGGILDVYSPAMEAPVRAEFFGDEVDALGIFDPVTQRRTANVEQAVLLPAAETLPHLAPGGLAGLLKQLDQRSAAAVRDGLEELAATLRQDREALEERESLRLRQVMEQLRAWGTDCTALGSQVAQANPARWEKLRGEWEERFSTIPYEVSVQVSVSRTYGDLA